MPSQTAVGTNSGKGIGGVQVRRGHLWAAVSEAHDSGGSLEGQAERGWAWILGHLLRSWLEHRSPCCNCLFWALCFSWTWLVVRPRAGLTQALLSLQGNI